MSPEDEALAAEHRREETVTDDLRAGLQGDHDSPWSYGPWDLPPSHAEIASQES